jgi:hypothetical protein
MCNEEKFEGFKQEWSGNEKNTEGDQGKIRGRVGTVERRGAEYDPRGRTPCKLQEELWKPCGPLQNRDGRRNGAEGRKATPRMADPFTGGIHQGGACRRGADVCDGDGGSGYYDGSSPETAKFLRTRSAFIPERNPRNKSTGAPRRGGSFRPGAGRRAVPIYKEGGRQRSEHKPAGRKYRAIRDKLLRIRGDFFMRAGFAGGTGAFAY